MKKTIVIACDHAGFELKKTVVAAVEQAGFEVLDVGTDSRNSADFPDFAQLGAEKITNGKAERGIFLCGSGVGMCIAANKIPGIYASVAHDTYTAHQAVEHDGMNVLCLGSRVIGDEVVRELVAAFLGAEFNHQPNQTRRLEKIKRIERGDLYLSDRIQSRMDCGQSVWYGSLSRGQIKGGELARLIQTENIRGLSSDSCTLCDAIINSNDYETAMIPMVLAGWSPRKIFDQVSVEDIREAAGHFRTIYVESNGQDGFVTLGIDPELVHDADRTIAEVKRIWTAVNRPNLMIGIPATDEGLSACRQLISDGINVLITQIFSEKRFIQANEAYLSGLEARLAAGNPLNNIRSVASVNPALIDEKINAELRKAADPAASVLTNTAGIAICQRIYAQFQKINASERMQNLIQSGAKAQQLLWSSAGQSSSQTRGTALADALLGENTILSVRKELLDAVKDHGRTSPALPAAEGESDEVLIALQKAGVSVQFVLDQLEEESMDSYKDAFAAMSGELENRAEQVQKFLGALYTPVFENFQKLEADSIIQRMFAKDPTVWTFDTQAYPEIRNRLGWLDAHQNIAKSAQEFTAIAKDLKASGIRKVLLLGMGGSSLAPEVLALTFKEADGMSLQIVDSTDPGQVLAADEAHPLNETVYIVSSKSGGTAEIKAFLDYFYAKAQRALGDQAGSHFIAITDPGTALERTAKEAGFRYTVLADPAIGGRFSALSPFGILPAVLIGIDPEKIAKQAARMAKICAPSNPAGCNEGAALGVYMGTAALNGRDKLTILTDPELAAFGSWLEQLIAESSGKNGKGIIPVDIEPELQPGEYPQDRCFVYVDSSGTKNHFVEQLTAAGQPVLIIRLNDLHELFGEFYRWEIAISIACSMLGVNAFDQPNVQDSKNRTVAKINEYKEAGKLQEFPVVWEADGIKAYYNFDAEPLRNAKNITEFLNAFRALAVPGSDYIGINAYLPRTAQTLRELQELRANLLDASHCATTLGFGPRFQHSTGQLHKGGPNNGVFLQLVADCPRDAEIPNEGMTFAVLERAQALGDFEALLAMNRRSVRLDLGDRPLTDLL